MGLHQQFGMLTYILAVACCFAASQALIQPGRCPDVKAKSDMDYSMLSGSWLEYSRFYNFGQTLNKCVTFDVTVKASDTTEVTLEITGINELTNRQTRIVNSFKADPETSGELTQDGLRGMLFGMSLKVLGTDYSNYAILYSCQDMLLFNTQQAWVLTRSTLSPEKRAELIGVLETNNLNIESFTYTDQISCSN